MTIDESILEFGNQIGISDALGLRRGSITVYKDQGGIPYRHQCTLEKLTNGRLKADRRHDPKNAFYEPQLAVIVDTIHSFETQLKAG
jgi:hypothetical protein